MAFPTVASLTGVIAHMLPEPHAGLLAGIMFGTKATLAGSLLQAFITTGTVHIIALSGTNISIIENFVALTLLRVVSRRIASLLTVLIIVGFVWFVGPSPSIIRAAIMGTISLFAVILGKQRWPLFAWLLAVSSMIVLNPLWIGDLSFQLSALSSLGIILFSQQDALGGSFFTAPVGKTQGKHPVFTPSEVEGLQKSRHPASLSLRFLGYTIKAFQKTIRDDLRTTLAAQVLTIPLVIVAFGRISLISPLANILIGWTIAPVTILGYVAAFLGAIWVPAGQVVSWFAWALLEYMMVIVNLLARLQYASIGG